MINSDDSSEPETVSPTKPARRAWRMGSDTELYRHLETYDRSPIVAELARWLANGPSDEALAELADTRPDRWALALKSIAGLAGFTTDRTETLNTNITAVIDMSDSQLREALAAKLAQLGMAATPLTIEAQAEPVADALARNMAAAGLREVVRIEKS